MIKFEDTLVGAKYFLVIASALLNIHLFWSLSAMLFGQIVFALIGLSLDLVKSAAIGLRPEVGMRRRFIRRIATLLFIAISVVASTVAINSAMEISTTDLATNDQELSLIDTEIEQQHSYIATLQQNLADLPADWPRNREEVIGHIQTARQELGELTETRRSLTIADQDAEPTNHAGQFIYDLASLSEHPVNSVRLLFSFLVALLIDVGIWFAAWMERPKEPETTSASEDSGDDTTEDQNFNEFQRFLELAYPEHAQQRIVSARHAAQKSGLSRERCREIHRELKEAGFIGRNGVASVSTAPRSEVAQWYNARAA